MSSDPSDLPIEIQRLWGITSRHRLGRPAELDLATILDKAISIADAEGLDELSMGRIASDLGYSTMSLYRHVSDKNELLTLMAEVASPPPPQLTGTWREGMEIFTRSVREVYRNRPWILKVPISRPPVGPRTLSWMEACMASLAGTNLEGSEKVGVALLLMGHARNDAALQTDLHRGLNEGESAADAELEYERVLQRLLDPAEFPHLTHLFSGSAPSEPDPKAEVDTGFEFGLACILDGVAALLASRED